MKLSEAFAKRTYDRALEVGSEEDVGTGERSLAQGLTAITLKDLEGTDRDNYHDAWLLANESYFSDSISRVRGLVDEILRAHYNPRGLPRSGGH